MTLTMILSNKTVLSSLDLIIERLKSTLLKTIYHLRKADCKDTIIIKTPQHTKKHYYFIFENKQFLFLLCSDNQFYLQKVYTLYTLEIRGSSFTYVS